MPCSVQKKKSTFYVNANRTFSDDGTAMDLHCSIWWPRAPGDYRALEMWTILLRNLTSEFLLTLINFNKVSCLRLTYIARLFLHKNHFHLVLHLYTFKIILGQFSTTAQFGQNIFWGVGTVLCTVRCLAAPLASTQERQVAMPQL